MLLAVDPGREKCGLALLEGQRVIRRAVVPAGELGPTIAAWAAEGLVHRVVVGNRTGRQGVRAVLERTLPGVPVLAVSEAGTTLEARRLYFTEHPPRGWHRLLPLSLQVPPEPYDDYAAVVLGRRHLRGRPAPETAD